MSPIIIYSMSYQYSTSVLSTAGTKLHSRETQNCHAHDHNRTPFVPTWPPVTTQLQPPKKVVSSENPKAGAAPLESPHEMASIKPIKKNSAIFAAGHRFCLFSGAKGQNAGESSSKMKKELKILFDNYQSSPYWQ